MITTSEFARCDKQNAGTPDYTVILYRRWHPTGDLASVRYPLRQPVVPGLFVSLEEANHAGG